MAEKERLILAYSGGLDTSVLVHWLSAEKGFDVITATADVGQPCNFHEIKEKALLCGATNAEVIDARLEFVNEYVIPALWANALYEGEYPLATALARPLIAKIQVELAHKHKAKFLAHGCTAKGNDQVRFEVAIRALDPSLKVLAPMREWKMTRAQEIEYAKEKGIPVPVTMESPYSVDENLWGRSCECGVLEDPWHEPPADTFEWTALPESGPDEAEYIEIGFERGMPVTLDGKKSDIVSLIETLNRRAGKHGVGRIDLVEDRVVGIKSREIYEAPAAIVLITAHRDLERLTLPYDCLNTKWLLEKEVSRIAYDGLWFSPLNEAIEAFNSVIQENVNGVVRVKLYKGNVKVVGRKSPNSLYDRSLATYEGKDAFEHDASSGFIKLWGLPLEIWARRNKKEKQ
ncbi:MAG: argininosuccinate synthase [Actinomycetota bacterium]|nr:argininosuccinate synthase [Actinomycetota bacterium]